MQTQISCLKTHGYIDLLIQHKYEITYTLHKIDLKELALDVEKSKEKPFTINC